MLAFITAIGYYVPHYFLQLFIQYLESDPTRSDPAWGWFLAFGLFISNAVMYIAGGIIWSISTTMLQSRIKLQLNTMLFNKTLVKKDVAATGEDSEKAKKADKDSDAAEEDDEAVNSKAQIMVSFNLLPSAHSTDSLHRRCRPCHRICLPRCVPKVDPSSYVRVLVS